MAKCSFGKISTKGAFEAVWPYGTDLYGRLFYVNAGGNEVLLCAFDFTGNFPSEAARFRLGVAEKTGIPAQNIWYHELQIHAAPDGRHLNGQGTDELIRRVAEAVPDLRARAVTFSCEVAEADFGSRFTMNREQYVAGLGGVTVWSGMSFDEQKRPYSQNPDIMLLRGYKPDLSTFDQPIPFDNPVDSKAYLFVFRDEAGKVIGTLSRFAAHPDVAVLFELRHIRDHHYDFDWPGYLSEKLERTFDAPSMYINGPCANISTKKGWDGMDSYEKAAAECRRIGEELADALLERYHRKTVPLGDPDHCRADTFTFELPMREDFPTTREDWTEHDRIQQEQADELQRAKDENRPAWEVKKLSDLWWRTAMEKSMVLNICGFDEETLKRRTVTTTVSALQLGDYLFIGVPGESLVDMGLWLRASFTGVKTIAVDQVGGYYCYMASPTTLTLGGYTYWCSWVRRDAVDLLKQGIVEKMEEFLDK